MGPPLKTSPKRIGHTYKYYVTAFTVHCFAIHLDSRVLSRLRRPVGRFNTELLGVLRVQPLPAAELHRLTTNDAADRSEEHTSELQSRLHLVCRLLLEKKKKNNKQIVQKHTNTY